MIKYLDLKRISDLYDAELREAVNKVLDSGWYLKGEATRQFETHYAEYIGTRHCIGCGNGLDALTLILKVYIKMGVMAVGDEVIVPANTFIASVLAITENNLVPVFAEPRLDTLVIDDSSVEALITERTRAIMIVHLYVWLIAVGFQVAYADCQQQCGNFQPRPDAQNHRRLLPLLQHQRRN